MCGMDFSTPSLFSESHAGTEQRSAARYISLIRAAKLITSAGEFVCVVRDVSQTGVKVKTFHRLPADGQPMELELQNGERFGLHPVRENAGEASFVFAQPVVLERLISEHWSHPKRQFRLAITFPVRLLANGGSHDAQISNLSQQGARLTTDAHFAVHQLVRIEAKDLLDVHAKVRWHRSGMYGMVFEDTFGLPQIAHLAALIQCPALLQDQ
jgi:hypothetical protein